MKLIRYLELCKQLSGKVKRTEDNDLKIIKGKKGFLNDSMQFITYFIS